MIRATLGVAGLLVLGLLFVEREALAVVVKAYLK